MRNFDFYFYYIGVFFFLLYLVPKNTPSCLLWFVAGVSCAFVDCVRIDRWRYDYKSSIKRVIVCRSVGRNANAVNSIKTLTVAAYCVKPARKSPLFDRIV
jgi:hypothetical protein